MYEIWKYIAIGILTIVWIWLAVYVFIKNGITLLNILWVGISGVIVFLPLYKRYFKRPD